MKEVELSEEMKLKKKREEEAKIEQELLEFIREHNRTNTCNVHRVELLNAIKSSNEFILCCLSLYCIVMSLFMTLNQLGTSFYLKWSVAAVSVGILFLNIFRVILIEQIDKEFGYSFMTRRKLSTDIWRLITDNVIMTFLICTFPNDFLALFPRFKLSDFYIDFNVLAHLVQLTKSYFVLISFVSHNIYSNDSAYRIWYSFSHPSNMFGVPQDWMFVLKCRMRSRPIAMMASSVLLSILIYSYALYIAENMLPVAFGDTPFLADFKTSVWMTCVTITTGNHEL